MSADIPSILAIARATVRRSDEAIAAAHVARSRALRIIALCERGIPVQAPHDASGEPERTGPR